MRMLDLIDEVIDEVGKHGTLRDAMRLLKERCEEPKLAKHLREERVFVNGYFTFPYHRRYPTRRKHRAVGKVTHLETFRRRKEGRG